MQYFFAHEHAHKHTSTCVRTHKHVHFQSQTKQLRYLCAAITSLWCVDNVSALNSKHASSSLCRSSICSIPNGQIESMTNQKCVILLLSLPNLSHSERVQWHMRLYTLAESIYPFGSRKLSASYWNMTKQSFEDRRSNASCNASPTKQSGGNRQSETNKNSNIMLKGVS